ncbi:MAG: LysM peptidoglycan-binding domain-containing protein [Bacteroidetes bacterium]|nr:LysM peptidoglycan-binding domain-containing protein [Bacteroidota bacterium]
MALFLAVLAQAAPADSIGTKVKNGKIFIMHKVEKAQGLFAISRRYGVPLSDILEHNPGADKNLQVDQIVLVPTGKDAPFEEKVVVDYFSGGQTKPVADVSQGKSTFARYHTVETGETLYSISVKYNTKVDVLKSLNNLKSDALSPGQELMVPSEDTDQAVATDNPPKKADTLKKDVAKVTDNSNTANTGTMGKVVNGDYERKVEKLTEFDIEKIWEKGVAGDLVFDEADKRRICSHHSAEIGTTIMVTNPANNKAVFVKVVKNHPLNTETENKIIELSQAARDYISLDSGKPVEISFAR